MLRIDVGSLMTKDSQLGLAHFKEHMAFNGTEHIPKNDLNSILARLGLTFGADLHAATSPNEYPTFGTYEGAVPAYDRLTRPPRNRMLAAVPPNQARCLQIGRASAG